MSSVSISSVSCSDSSENSENDSFNLEGNNHAYILIQKETTSIKNKMLKANDLSPSFQKIKSKLHSKTNIFSNYEIIILPISNVLDFIQNYLANAIHQMPQNHEQIQKKHFKMQRSLTNLFSLCDFDIKSFENLVEDNFVQLTSDSTEINTLSDIGKSSIIKEQKSCIGSKSGIFAEKSKLPRCGFCFEDFEKSLNLHELENADYFEICQKTKKQAKINQNTSFLADHRETSNLTSNDYTSKSHENLLINLTCNHKFCRACLNLLFQSNLDQNKALYKLTCPNSACASLINIFDILKISREPSILIRLANQVAQRISCVPDSPAKICSDVGCDSVLFRTRPSNQKSKNAFICMCYNRKCSECFGTSHFPLSCQQKKFWEKKILSANEKFNQIWLQKNTKKCPNCDLRIGKMSVILTEEKNEGCLHLTCSKCEHQFCWICLGDWALHVPGQYYKCDQFGNKKADEQATQSQSDLLKVATGSG